MKNRKVLIIILVLLAVSLFIYSQWGSKKELVAPSISESDSSNPTPLPQTPSFNPPPAVEYEGSTDLKQELEGINPQVLDSDFE